MFCHAVIARPASASAPSTRRAASAHSAADAVGSAPSSRIRAWSFENVRELRLSALGDQDVRQLAQRRTVSGALTQARPQDLGRVAALLEQPAETNDLEAQRETALLIAAAIELGDPQGDGVGETALGLVETRERLARGLVVGRLLVQQPPDPDRARPVVERALGQLRGPPQPSPAPLVGHPQPGAVEQQRGRPVHPLRRFRDATCSRTVSSTA